MSLFISNNNYPFFSFLIPLFLQSYKNLHGKRMNLLEVGYYTFRNGKLFCEEVPVEEIARQVGTPAYIYSKNYMKEQFLSFTNAFNGINHTIFFAAKSNFNLNVIKLFYDLGAGVDVNSSGELYRVKKIGVDPKRVILTGVGKTTEEIKLGLEFGVKMIKAESISEVIMIDKIAREMNLIAPVAIRINPDVDAKTHPYISTGLAKNKFGIDALEVEKIFVEANKLKNINLCGIDMHIGSQITTVEPFAEAIGKMADMYYCLTTLGIPLKHFDIGGGMGVRYNEEKIFSPGQLAEKVQDQLKELNCEIMFEPGRYLTANAGILVTEIQYIKKNRGKNFIIIDAAMTELLRPALYGAYHHIQPVNVEERRNIIADIVGGVCESSDYLAKDREIQECKEKELLAVMTTGAYAMVMSSNYNGRRRPPEVIVDKDKFYVSRSRETYEHLLWDEKIISGLHQ